MSDMILLLLINYAEAENPVETQVNLLVNGMIISGNVISQKKYISHCIITKYIMSEISDLTQKFPELIKSDLEDSTPDYIHIGNARCLIDKNNIIPDSTSFTFRIALKDVCGFSFGDLRTEIQ